MLTPPPRPLSVPLILQTLFGGLFSQFGWAFLSFGLIFGWIFAADTLLNAWRFHRELASVDGRVLAVETTSMRINRKPVIAHQVSYRVSGQQLETTGYTTGSGLPTGTHVIVSYRPDRPGLARVDGMRAGGFEGWETLFVLIFPLVGLSVVLIQLGRGGRALQLLHAGQLVQARLRDRVPTHATVNRRPVWKLRFAYSIQGHEYICTHATHQPERLLQGSGKNLLYDPARPQRALLLESLPVGIVDGQFRLIQPGRVWLTLLLPVLACTIACIGWRLKTVGGL